MTVKNLKELAELIAKRDNVSYEEACISIQIVKEAIPFCETLQDVEFLLLDELGLELDYFELFV